MTERPGVLETAKLITCILPKGKAKLIQEALVKERSIHAANFHRGRGVGRFSPVRARGIGEQQEKEILEVCVSADLADELFEFMFFVGEMDRPHGGMMFMTELVRGMHMKVPDLPGET
jgi:hypothetical protein